MSRLRRRDEPFAAVLAGHEQDFASGVCKRQTAFYDLRKMYWHHQETITAVWRQATGEERRQLLKRAWPSITASLPTDMTIPLAKSREYALWPYLNLEVLAQSPEVLLRMLFYRATTRNSPKHYQHVDMHSIYETKDEPYANFQWACRLSTLHFDRLGRIPVRLVNAAPWYFKLSAAHLHDPDFGVQNVNMVMGRKLVEIQAHLYHFLVDICTEIMKLSSIPQDQWWDLRCRTPSEPPIGDIQEVGGLLNRYYGPPNFDNLRIRELLNAQVSKVTELLLNLRANPQRLEAFVIKERLRSDPLASKVDLEQDFNLLEEKTWMDSVRTCVTTALEDVDRWTGLRDACHELPVDFSPSESVRFLAFNEHVQEIKKYLFETFEKIPSGTDPLSSGYFSINSREKIGAKTEKRLHTLHAKLVLLTGERKRRDLEVNVLESILGSLQVDLGRSKCPINSEVRRLLEHFS